MNNDNLIPEVKNNKHILSSKIPLFIKKDFFLILGIILFLVTVGFSRNFFEIKDPDYEYLQKTIYRIDQKILAYQNQKMKNEPLNTEEEFFKPVINSFGGVIQVIDYNNINQRYNFKITELPQEFCNNFAMNFSNYHYMTKINGQVIKPISQSDTQRGANRRQLEFIGNHCNLLKNEIIILNKTVNQNI